MNPTLFVQRWNTSNISDSAIGRSRSLYAPRFASQASTSFRRPNCRSNSRSSHQEGKSIASRRTAKTKVTREVHFTEEVLLIQKGWLQVHFYTVEEEYLESRALSVGDIILLCSGAYGFHSSSRSRCLRSSRFLCRRERQKVVLTRPRRPRCPVMETFIPVNTTLLKGNEAEYLASASTPGGSRPRPLHQAFGTANGAAAGRGMTARCRRDQRLGQLTSACMRLDSRRAARSSSRPSHATRSKRRRLERPLSIPSLGPGRQRRDSVRL